MQPLSCVPPVMRVRELLRRRRASSAACTARTSPGRPGRSGAVRPSELVRAAVVPEVHAARDVGWDPTPSRAGRRGGRGSCSSSHRRSSSGAGSRRRRRGGPGSTGSTQIRPNHQPNPPCEPGRLLRRAGGLERVAAVVRDVEALVLADGLRRDHVDAVGVRRVRGRRRSGRGARTARARSCRRCEAWSDVARAASTYRRRRPSGRGRSRVRRTCAGRARGGDPTSRRRSGSGWSGRSRGRCRPRRRLGGEHELPAAAVVRRSGRCRARRPR